MRKGKICQIYLIVSFIIILLLPLLYFERKDNAVSFVRAKILSDRPKVYLEGNWNKNFMSEFQQYVEDRIGFRDDAIAAVLVCKYRLFQMLDIPDFSLGNNDNIYYSNNFEQIDVYSGKSKYSIDELSDMARSMVSMQEALLDKNTDLYCVYIPNKEGIYWENYITGVAVRTESSRMDDFYNYISKNTKIKAINLKDDFLLKKNEKLLYYQVYDGSHWNQNGAVRGMQIILKRIGEDYSDIQNISLDNYIKRETNFIGCMERYKEVPFINNSFKFQDTIISYEPIDGWMSSAIENDIIKKGEIHYHNDEVDNDKSILILGDSYMGSFCLNYFAEQFQDVYFMSYGTAPEDVLDLCEKTECDMVLFEIVERCFSKELYTRTISGYKQ